MPRYLTRGSVQGAGRHDEAKHIVDWINEQNQLGFTKEVTPEDDHEQLAEVYFENRCNDFAPKQTNGPWQVPLGC